jgi:peptidoglycan/LPS O-acetylase OafA/YrhL
MDSLFLGLLCAYYLREPRAWDWLVKNRSTTWTVILILCAGIPVLSSPGIPLTLLWLSVGYGWMSALYASLVILALTDPQGLFDRAMRQPWIVDLGTTSYGVYLFHLGIFGILSWMLHGHEHALITWRDCGIILLALALSMGLAKLSWLYFEKPIVRWSHGFRY